eukprot:1140095-Pelagomonas_calceolata.AAC.4
MNKKEGKEIYVGRGNSPYINQGKGDTLAQKSRESPSPRSYKKKTLMGIWRVIGSTRLHNLAARSIFVFNSTPSGNKLVGNIMMFSFNFGSLIACGVRSNLLQPGRGHSSLIDLLTAVAWMALSSFYNLLSQHPRASCQQELGDFAGQNSQSETVRMASLVIFDREPIRLSLIQAVILVHIWDVKKVSRQI